MDHLEKLREDIKGLDSVEFDFPDERREMRLKIILDAAVSAADELLMEGSDGSEEETDWLTSAFTLKFAEKAHHAHQRELLKKMLSDRIPGEWLG